MSDKEARGPLQGRRIALPEMREAERLAALLREQGAEVVGCPLVAIVDVPDPLPAAAWLARFIAKSCDDLILLTGEGLRRLCGCARRSGSEAAFVAALAQARKITRGPKPAQALREIGLKPDLRAPEPTTAGIVAALSGEDLRGRRVGVQLYPGIADPVSGHEAGNRLVDFLGGAGALPDPVLPYAYAAAADDDRVAALIDRMAAGRIDVIAFTSASQVARLFAVAQATGRAEALRAAFSKIVAAAVGPIAAEALGRRGVAAQIVPSGRYFMKPLVAAIVEATARA
jgi:uroporphyrinogen-III synthase